MVDTQSSFPSRFLDSSCPGSSPKLDWRSDSARDSMAWAETSHYLGKHDQYKPSKNQDVSIQMPLSRDRTDFAEHRQDNSSGRRVTRSNLAATYNSNPSSRTSSTVDRSFSTEPATYDPIMTNSNYVEPFYPRLHSQLSQVPSRASSRPASPVFQQSTNVPSSARSLNGSVIVPYLQLPSTISTTKGSLAEFAAQITCLFWFETSATLNQIETSTASPSLGSKLVSEAYPATGFMKWVTTILSTTQVTQNVILLALLFIHRLKKQCPNVKGKLGSEYRLLTVALMLGNKFLDDNTYTNKTWAEVSGISVHEIHVMEVEFLSHMKYNLYTSKEQWDHWHQQLAVFWQYFDQTSRQLRGASSKEVEPRRQPLQVPYALPSPPASTNASPPYLVPTSPTPAPVGYSNGTGLPPHLAPLMPLPATPMADFGRQANGRKRSYDNSVQEPPAKRQSMYGPYPLATSTTAYGQSVSFDALPTLPSLSMPNLPMPVSSMQQAYGNSRSSVTPQTTKHTSRNTSPTHLPPLNWLAGMPSSTTPTSAQHHPFAYPDNQTERRSRQQQYTPMATPANDSSPTAMPPSSATHLLPPNQLSPSHFLTQRSSPYRPVRNISTLLVPPPSNYMQQYPTNMSHDQMRWQPLSKTVEERPGRVPYLTRDAWPDTHQFNHWPPAYPAS